MPLLCSLLTTPRTTGTGLGLPVSPPVSISQTALAHQWHIVVWAHWNTQGVDLIDELLIVGLGLCGRGEAEHGETGDDHRNGGGAAVADHGLLLKCRHAQCKSL